jgi:hypothetical protein
MLILHATNHKYKNCNYKLKFSKYMRFMLDKFTFAVGKL